MGEAPALAIEKGVFHLPAYTTISGGTIRDVKVGYETYGKLNAAKDNVVMIEHYLLGNCHAAGKYTPQDPLPGFWDAIIGSGKSIDTDKYFVVCMNCLGNINTKDPNTVTTGPASIDPETGKPYGMSFPAITFRDSVRVQKAFLDSLGVKKLKAVAGPSVGAMLSMSWAAEFPEMVEKCIPVVPTDLSSDPYLIGNLSLWMAPVMLDPKWNGGDYYGKEEPVQGLGWGIKNVVLGAHHYLWARQNFGDRWADPNKNPAMGFANKFAVEAFCDQLAGAFVPRYDANSFLYMVRQIQTFTIRPELEKLKSQFLIIPAKNDIVHYLHYAQSAAETLKQQGLRVEWAEIEGNAGHFDGLSLIGQASEAIRRFMLD